MSWFDTDVIYTNRAYVELRTACVSPPRCFVTPPNESAKLIEADLDSGIDRWLTTAAPEIWYELNLEDATGFFSDPACLSERCPGTLLVYRGHPVNRVTGTYRCPIGTVKWLSIFSNAEISFNLQSNTQFLSEVPNGCIDLAGERRCNGQGTYTSLIGSTEPDGCTATSLRDIECPTVVTGINVRGQCEGYADCTDLGERRIESVPFQYPESVVRNWAVTDDSTVVPTPNSVTPAPPSPSPVEITTPMTGNPTDAPSTSPTIKATDPPSPSHTTASDAASLKKKLGYSTIVIVWWLFTFV